MKLLLCCLMLSFCNLISCQMFVPAEDEEIWVGPVDTIKTIVPFLEPQKRDNLILYKKGDLFGMADVNGQIVIEPLYDKVNPLSRWDDQQPWPATLSGYYMERPAAPTGYYTVQQGDSSALVTKDKIIIPFEAGNFSARAKIFIYNWAERALYNYKGEKLFSEVYNFDCLNIDVLSAENQYVFAVSSAEKNGVFAYDIKSQSIVKWLFEFENGIEIINYEKEPRIAVWQDNGNNADTYQIIVSEGINAFQLVPLSKEQNSQEYDAMMAHPNVKMVSEYDRELRKARYSKDITKLHHELFLKDNGIFLERKYSGYNYRMLPVCDTVAIKLEGIENYQLKTFGNHGTYNTKPLIDSDKLKADTMFYYKNYLLYQHQNKFGIVIANDIISPLYDTIKRVSIAEKPPHFIVGIKQKDRMKWGMINSKGETVIPIIYDAIQKSETDGRWFGENSIWIVKNNHKFGLITLKNDLVLPVTYERITPNRGRYFSFDLMDGGLYGSYRHPELIVPKFKYPVSSFGQVHIAEHSFYRLVDADENFIGYVRDDGLEFFE